jgi:hypothetical protein
MPYSSQCYTDVLLRENLPDGLGYHLWSRRAAAELLLAAHGGQGSQWVG